MKFFSKKAKADPPVKQDGITNTVTERILSHQRRWADRMQAYSEHLSRSGKLSVLAIGVVVMSIVCLYAICAPMLKKSTLVMDTGKMKSIVKLEPTVVPLKDDRIVRLQRFKKIIDSLSSSPTGRQRWEQINKEHPGLLDSLTMISKMYEGLDE